MDGSDEPPSPPPFPPRMFALGDEPVGVTPYHKPTCIRKILNALEPDEAQTIRETQFGKLVEIADKPSFSGRFGRFLLSPQLKVAKKHEVRFLFAGKPVRFSQLKVTDRQYRWRRHGKPSSFSPELSIFIFGFWHTNISNNALHNKLLRMYLAFIHKDCTLCFV